MKFRQYFCKNIFSKSPAAKIYKSIWMILGPLKALSERAFTASIPIDFLSLNPERIAAKYRIKGFVTKDTPFSLIIKKHNYIDMFLFDNL